VTGLLSHPVRAALDRHRALVAGPLAAVALALLAFSVLTLTGNVAQGAPPKVSTDPTVVNAGRALYIAHCQSCHGVNGVGSSNGSPQLITAGAAAADFYLTTGRMPLNNPGDQPIRHHPFFTPDEIRQLDAYIAALPSINHANVSGPTIPSVLPVCARQQTTGCVTLSEGQADFALNCAQCHQGVGSGGMLSKGNVVPSLLNADSTQVAEAIRVGPKPMPVFGTGQLSDKQVSSIARYVEYLHRPANRGGLGISHFGPVAEGFVGIVGGFGLLLLFSRLIGNRG
jgi:ubiquinol-cytochrome c reductase cytochrome c subunit